MNNNVSYSFFNNASKPFTQKITGQVFSVLNERHISKKLYIDQMTENSGIVDKYEKVCLRSLGLFVCSFVCFI